MGEERATAESIELDEKQVKEAVTALFAYVRRDRGKKLLVDDEEKVHLQLTFKKVPQAKTVTVKIPLPHGLHDLKENPEICLFVKDLNRQRDYAPTVRHFKELLEEQNVTCISEIIPLKCLKTEYKPFEAKRNLSNRFDAYLSDERIVRLLPCHLGKNFYGRKRQPVQVNLKATDLKKEITRALHDTRCIIGGRGSTCQATIGHTGMTEESTVRNIMAAAQKLASGIPGGAVNVRNLYVKTTSAPALPIYVSLGSANDVELPKVEEVEEELEPEDVTTVEGAKVKVSLRHGVTIIPDGENKTPVNRPRKKKTTSLTRRKGRRNNYASDKNTVNGKVKVEVKSEDDSPPPAKRSKSSMKSKTTNIPKVKTENSGKTANQVKKNTTKKNQNQVKVKDEPVEPSSKATKSSVKTARKRKASR